MIENFLHAVIIVNILSTTIRIATPLMFTSLGELVSERSGVMNLGLEGAMLMGAYIGWLVTFETGSQWLGVGSGMLAALSVCMILAVLCITLNLNQSVVGISLNLLVSGITLFWYRVRFEGNISFVPTIEPLSNLKIPFLSDIPYVGQIFFINQWLTYVAFLLFPIIGYVLYRTRLGLVLRSAGENPRAVDTVGINVASQICSGYI